MDNRQYREEDLYGLAKEYQNLRASENLGEMMLKTIDHKTRFQRYAKGIGGAAAALAVSFLLGLNISPAFAAVMERTPLIGSAVKILTFRQYENSGNGYDVQVETARLEGMTDKTLESSLNQKYADQAEKLYKDFMAEVNAGGSNISLTSQYSVKAENSVTVSFQNDVSQTAGSSNETFTYDTLDKQKELYITLPSLFKDDSYIKIISGYIAQQIADAPDEDYFTGEGGFQAIDANQTFYINNDNQLVIVFNRYEIAPGSKGACEFIIPAEILRTALAGADYIH